MSGIVYILRSLKNYTYYIGSTNNLERRLVEHQSGKSEYTSEILPIELVFSQEFKNIQIARQIEYKLKKLKSRKIIQMIVESGKIFINEKGNINW